MPSHSHSRGSARSLSPRITRDDFSGTFSDSQIQSGPMRITRGMNTPRVTGTPGTITSRVNQGPSFVGSLASMTGDQTRLSDPVLFPDTQSVPAVQSERPDVVNGNRITKTMSDPAISSPEVKQADPLLVSETEIETNHAILPQAQPVGPIFSHLPDGRHRHWRHRRPYPVVVPYPYYYPAVNFVVNVSKPLENLWQTRCNKKMMEVLDHHGLGYSLDALVAQMNARLPKRIRVAMEGSPPCPRLYITDYSRSKLGYDSSAELGVLDAWHRDAIRYGGMDLASWSLWTFVKANAPITKEYVSESY